MRLLSVGLSGFAGPGIGGRFDSVGVCAVFSAIVCFCGALSMPTDASAEPERLTSVLIFPLRVKGVKVSETDKIDIRNYLGTRLTIEKVYRVMPESQIKKDLGVAKLDSYNECYDDACRIELGGAVYADKSLSVDVAAESARCRVTATIYDIRQEVAENAADVVCGCSTADIKQSMKDVAAQLSGKKPTPTSVTTGTTVTGYSLPPPPDTGTGGTSVGVGGELPGIKAETGYLAVDGSPKGARVDITGPKDFGEKGRVATTLPVRPLPVPAGNYEIRVSAADYDADQRTVRVYADATETAKIDLVKSNGEIELSGKPEGAKSRLECAKGFVRDFGLPGAPVRITVPRGECRLKVERDGYETHDVKFNIEGGGLSRQSVDLKRGVTVESGGGTVTGGKGGIQWVRIPGGTFLMGADDGEADEKPVHQVSVKPFEMSRTEVTVRQYKECVDAGACRNPETDGSCTWGVSGFEDHPVNCLDWKRASDYAKWAGGRLPTEAEWEYAARAGTTGDRYGNVDEIAWYSGNSGGGTHPVGGRKPNAFGLFDMLGSVSEWCRDMYHRSYSGAPVDGRARGNSSGVNRVIRGGSCFSNAVNVQASVRGFYSRRDWGAYLGFRVARSVP